MIAGFLVARLVFASLLGPGIDESYTIAISRTLSLSYFDHPPLHQWMAHFAALALGEGSATRLPFILLFAATGWIYYRLSCHLFGGRAAIVALFALNVTPFFFASAGSWVVPDGPLLFGLALAASAAARIFFPAPNDRSRAWLLWLLVGFGFGLAGLSKYSAALCAAGLAAFVVLAPRQRHWLRHPAPYAAAALALAMIAPVFVWNSEHGWASFAFQGSRGVSGGGLKPVQLIAMALGEIAYLSPWVFVPLAAGVIWAWRRRHDERNLFLLCLALPPIVVFTITPLWGARGFPHWTTPGWFFAFALMGAWIDQKAFAARTLRRSAFVSAGLLAAIVAVVVIQTSTGWPLRLMRLRPGVADPTLEAFGWRALRAAPALNPGARFCRRGQLAGCWQDRLGARSRDAGLCHFQRSEGMGLRQGRRTVPRPRRGSGGARGRPAVRTRCGAARLPAGRQAAVLHVDAQRRCRRRARARSGPGLDPQPSVTLSERPRQVTSFDIL